MATLEKIRSKSVLLVSIIFVALFLFIITIIDNPVDIFMDRTTVVNVNGDKVDYDKYQARINSIHQANPEATNVESSAIQSLITESLMESEFKKLGITATPDEISSLLVGENANPNIVNAFRQSFMGATPELVLSAINDPASMGLDAEQAAQFRNQYIEFENNLESQLKSYKLLNLISGSINANKLDSRAMFDEGNTTYTLATVSKSIFDEPDSVTSADIEKYYKEHREQYSIREAFGVNEPKRYIRYTYLDIVPSQMDLQRASQQANEALAMLENSQKMDTLVGNSAYIIEHKTGNAETVTASNIRGLKEFVDSANIGAAKIFNQANSANPNIVIARLVDRSVRSNSAQIVPIQVANPASADSIVALLKSGVAADSISGIQVGGSSPFEFTQNPELADSIKSAGVGGYFVYRDGIIGVGTISEPEQTYEYYTATYNIEPSRETIDGLNTRMRDFLIAAPTADLFTIENGMPQGLQVRDAIVGASDNAIPGVEDSQNMIAWAMNTDKGKVSRLYTSSKNSQLAAVAVVDEYKDYVTTSFPAVHDGISADAQQDKTAKNLIAAYTGKGSTLADYQKTVGATRIDTIRGVNFSNGRYGALSGARGHKAGDVVGPLRWGTSVVIYTVVDSEEGTMPFDEASNAAQFKNNAQRSIIGANYQNIVPLLLGNGKIENRIVNFTRQD